MMYKKACALMLVIAAPLWADEGMWQPHQLPELESVLKAKGLQIDVQSIAKLTEFPMNAVISLGGCTASFVSAKGLAVTNHHCAYGSIQYNSTADHNLLQKGFLAKDLASELPAAPGSKILVTDKVDNVSQQIQQELTPQLTGMERFEKIEQLRKELVAECEQTAGYRCELYSFHGGLEYYLIRQLEIRDVRLVYAPPSGVGKFGGDIDNWMWPRHTGDFSFYRAYVGKDGQPADYSADNQPFTPPSHLKVSAKGVQAGDFVMVVGYPGRTNRYFTADELRNQFTQVLPTAKRYREELIALIHQLAPENSESRVKYEAILASLANYAKNYDGMLQSYQQGAVQANKDASEAELKKWVQANPARQAKYKPALLEMQKLQTALEQTQQRDLILNYFNYAQLFSQANRLYRLAQENQKADADRESGFQQRDLPRIEAGLKRMTRSFDGKVDLEIALHFLKAYAALPMTQRIASMDKFFAIGESFDEAALREKLSTIYQQSQLGDEATRLAMMTKTAEELNASEDSAIQYARTVYADLLALEQADKQAKGKMSAVRPKVLAALIALNKEKGQPVYADANSTLRVTYGTVQGYQPKDAVTYQPFSTVQGILQKQTGQVPFDAPAAQISAIQAKQFGAFTLPDSATVPVNFLSNVDTTGGNSGSPTLNGNAELVGLLFDGVIEGIIGDYMFDPALTRSIHVDSRYLLWYMSTVDKADHLLSEMEIVGMPAAQ